MLNRRHFLGVSVGAGILSSKIGCVSTPMNTKTSIVQLDQAAAAPILNVDSIRSPVKIKSIELMQSGKYTFIRTRSKDGAEGIAVTNSRAGYLYPLLKELIIPCFIDKDARDLESLIDGVYVYRSNYKLSGLALWNCVAWVEFSLLDLLNQSAKCLAV